MTIFDLLASEASYVCYSFNSVEVFWVHGGNLAIITLWIHTKKDAAVSMESSCNLIYRRTTFVAYMA